MEKVLSMDALENVINDTRLKFFYNDEIFPWHLIPPNQKLKFFFKEDDKTNSIQTSLYKRFLVCKKDDTTFETKGIHITDQRINKFFLIRKTTQFTKEVDEAIGFHLLDKKELYDFNQIIALQKMMIAENFNEMYEMISEDCFLDKSALRKMLYLILMPIFIDIAKRLFYDDDEKDILSEKRLFQHNKEFFVLKEFCRYFKDKLTEIENFFTRKSKELFLSQHHDVVDDNIYICSFYYKLFLSVYFPDVVSEKIYIEKNIDNKTNLEDKFQQIAKAITQTKLTKQSNNIIIAFEIYQELLSIYDFLKSTKSAIKETHYQLQYFKIINNTQLSSFIDKNPNPTLEEFQNNLHSIIQTYITILLIKEKDETYQFFQNYSFDFNPKTSSSFQYDDNEVKTFLKNILSKKIYNNNNKNNNNNNKYTFYLSINSILLKATEETSSAELDLCKKVETKYKEELLYLLGINKKITSISEEDSKKIIDDNNKKVFKIQFVENINLQNINFIENIDCHITPFKHIIVKTTSYSSLKRQPSYHAVLFGKKLPTQNRKKLPTQNRTKEECYNERPVLYCEYQGLQLLTTEKYKTTFLDFFDNENKKEKENENNYRKLIFNFLKTKCNIDDTNYKISFSFNKKFSIWKLSKLFNYISAIDQYVSYKQTDVFKLNDKMTQSTMKQVIDSKQVATVMLIGTLNNDINLPFLFKNNVKIPLFTIKQISTEESKEEEEKEEVKELKEDDSDDSDEGEESDDEDDNIESLIKQYYTLQNASPPNEKEIAVLKQKIIALKTKNEGSALKVFKENKASKLETQKKRFETLKTSYESKLGEIEFYVLAAISFLDPTNYTTKVSVYTSKPKPSSTDLSTLDDYTEANKRLFEDITKMDELLKEKEILVKDYDFYEHFKDAIPTISSTFSKKDDTVVVFPDKPLLNNLIRLLYNLEDFQNAIFAIVYDPAKFSKSILILKSIFLNISNNITTFDAEYIKACLEELKFKDDNIESFFTNLTKLGENAATKLLRYRRKKQLPSGNRDYDRNILLKDMTADDFDSTKLTMKTILSSNKYLIVLITTPSITYKPILGYINLTTNNYSSTNTIPEEEKQNSFLIVYEGADNDNKLFPELDTNLTSYDIRIDSTTCKLFYHKTNKIYIENDDLFYSLTPEKIVKSKTKEKSYSFLNKEFTIADATNNLEFSTFLKKAKLAVQDHQSKSKIQNANIQQKDGFLGKLQINKFYNKLENTLSDAIYVMSNVIVINGTSYKVEKCFTKDIIQPTSNKFFMCYDNKINFLIYTTDTSVINVLSKLPKYSYIITKINKVIHKNFTSASIYKQHASNSPEDIRYRLDNKTYQSSSGMWYSFVEAFNSNSTFSTFNILFSKSKLLFDEQDEDLPSYNAVFQSDDTSITLNGISKQNSELFKNTQYFCFEDNGYWFYLRFLKLNLAPPSLPENPIPKVLCHISNNEIKIIQPTKIEKVDDNVLINSSINSSISLSTNSLFFRIGYRFLHIDKNTFLDEKEGFIKQVVDLFPKETITSTPKEFNVQFKKLGLYNDNYKLDTFMNFTLEKDKDKKFIDAFTKYQQVVIKEGSDNNTFIIGADTIDTTLCRIIFMINGPLNVIVFAREHKGLYIVKDYDASFKEYFEKLNFYTVEKFFKNNYNHSFYVLSANNIDDLIKFLSTSSSSSSSSTSSNKAIVILDLKKIQLHARNQGKGKKDNPFEEYMKTFDLLEIESFKQYDTGFIIEYHQRYYAFKIITDKDPDTKTDAIKFIETVKDVAENTNTTFTRFANGFGTLVYNQTVDDIDMTPTFNFDKKIAFEMNKTINQVLTEEVPAIPVVSTPVVGTPVVGTPVVKSTPSETVDPDCDDDENAECVFQWYKRMVQIIPYTNTKNNIDLNYFYNFSATDQIEIEKYEGLNFLSMTELKKILLEGKSSAINGKAFYFYDLLYETFGRFNQNNFIPTDQFKFFNNKKSAIIGAHRRDRALNLIDYKKEQWFTDLEKQQQNQLAKSSMTITYI